MLPARQRFHTHQRRCLQRNFGLVIVDDIPSINRASQLFGLKAETLNSRTGLSGGKWLAQQLLLQLACRSGLAQGPDDMQSLDLRKFLGALYDTGILSAHQQQAPRIAGSHQMPDEFNAVHIRHLQVAEN
ncbi:hypothetical protein D3C72_1022110 [compost metagenome]